MFLTVDIINGVAVARFSEPVNETVLTRDISTGDKLRFALSERILCLFLLVAEYRISLTPLEPDRLEHGRVEVRDSTTETAGEGLFARTDFTVGDLVSILNGTRCSPSTQDEWSDYKVRELPGLIKFLQNA